MARILLGTSGWSYDEWVGPVYRSRDEPKLRRYSIFFETAEIDSTFYSYPREEVIRSMARSVPSGFVFTAKAPHEVTHRRALDVGAGAVEAMDRFLRVMKPMNELGMLGCILLQLPPSMGLDLDRLERFLQGIDTEFRYAVEFRHPSWLRDDVFEMLRKYHVAYTVVDEPLLPPVVEVTADFSYVRWYGRGLDPWYNYLYSDGELRPWIPRVKRLSEGVKTVYGYFNNHFHGYAVYNCIRVLEMLGLAEEKHRKLKTQIENYFTMAGISPDRPVELDEVERLLSTLSDQTRIVRAREIGDEQVKIARVTDNAVEAMVKGYHVEIDVQGRTINHSCPDWQKGADERRLCKHINKLLLTIPRENALTILENITQTIHRWRFENPHSNTPLNIP